MNSNKAIYKANKFYSLPILLFPPLLTLVLILENDQVKIGELMGLGGFWLMALMFVFIPFVSRLEIEDGVVRTYIFNFCILELHSSDIRSMNYGNLFRGGLGYGKGLNIRVTIKGKNKTTSLGEKFWSKEAIEHAKRALEYKK